MLNLNVQLNTRTDFDTYLETRDSNPHSLDPKSNALPIKLVSKQSTTLNKNFYLFLEMIESNLLTLFKNKYQLVVEKFSNFLNVNLLPK